MEANISLVLNQTISSTPDLHVRDGVTAVYSMNFSLDIQTTASSPGDAVILRPGSVASFAPLDILSPVQLIQRAMALIGLVGNIIAMVVVIRGHSIRKHASYVLLFNQSLADLLSCFLVLIWPLVSHFNDVTPGSLSSSAWNIAIRCVILYSQSPITANTVVSTYNLMLLAAERMMSVAYPIQHRVHASDRKQRLVALALWPCVWLVVYPFVIADNGLNDRGSCHYNDRMQGRWWFDLAYETVALYFPLTLITWCYVIIIRRLAAGGAAVKRRLVNVLRTLVTVVVVYVLCSALRNVLAIMVAFEVSLGDRRLVLFTVAYSLRILSFCVNPLIYTLQYADYRAELKSMLGFNMNKVTSSSA